mgnify:FL=1
MKKTDDPEYFKKYYQMNKAKIKENSRKNYLKKKGMNKVDVKITIRNQPVILSFD